MADNYRFAESDSLLCYHGPLLYEAKCLKRRKTNDGKAQYFIHYKGWNSKWEEWVDDIRVLTVNASNMHKMATLKALHSSTKKVPTKRTSIVIKEETGRNTTPTAKGRKRKYSEMSPDVRRVVNVPTPPQPKPKRRGRPPKNIITPKIEIAELTETLKSLRSTASKMTVSGATASKTTVSEATTSKTTVSKPTTSKTTVSDATVSKTTVTDAIVFKTTVSEATSFKTTVSEATTPKTIVSTISMSNAIAFKTNVSEATASDYTASETSDSGATVSEAIGSKTTVSEDTASETTDFEATVSKFTVSEAAVTKSTVFEVTESEATASEATASEATASEATASEAIASEATASEATASEAIATEATASGATTTEVTELVAIVSEATATDNTTSKAIVSEVNASKATDFEVTAFNSTVSKASVFESYSSITSNEIEKLIKAATESIKTTKVFDATKGNYKMNITESINKVEKKEVTEQIDETNETEDIDVSENSDASDEIDETQETEDIDVSENSDASDEIDETQETEELDLAENSDETDEIDETNKSDETDKVDAASVVYGPKSPVEIDKMYDAIIPISIYKFFGLPEPEPEPDNESTKNSETEIPKEIRIMPKLAISDAFKKLLSSDFINVKNNKVLSFPKYYTTHRLIRSYICSKALLDFDTREDSVHLGLTLIQYFNTLIHKQLLYPEEHKFGLHNKAKIKLSRQFKNNLIEDDFIEILTPRKGYHFIYGPVYLIRLLVKLPNYLAESSYTNAELVDISNHIDDFLKFCDQNFPYYFSENNYVSMCCNKMRR